VQCFCCSQSPFWIGEAVLSIDNDTQILPTYRSTVVSISSRL
jgi:hypothetical protein